MALIDLQCDDDACAEVVINHARAAADWQTTPPCPACGGPTTRIFLPPRVTWTVDPVVVYKAPDGSFRYPGDADGPASAKYSRAGYERLELRSAADVRRFEAEASRQQTADESRRVEGRHAQRLRRESENRGELFRRMKTMSNAGRDLAHAAMARGNARPQERSHGAPVTVEVYSYDRSNRERGPVRRRD